MSNWKKAYEQWKGFEQLEPALSEKLIDMESDTANLEDAFYDEITFGTGGMRGVLGPGTNRMNIYTVRKAIKGLTNYILTNRVNVKDRGVVVAYDSRYMSKEFSLEVAKVLGVHGIKTYIFESIRPTPLLSFAVRYLGTVAGIMITASHNPPEYNGFKVYNEEGSQVTTEEAEDIIMQIKNVANELTIPILEEAELNKQNLIQWINGEVDHAYLEQLYKISKMDEATINRKKELQIVFTPLHGTALKLVSEGLKQLNFPHVHVVEKQAVPDPAFSTVKSPNPEEHQAFQEAIKLGVAKNADILLATDPDADRLGVAVKNKHGDYVVLTGNQLGSLMLDYILAYTSEDILRSARVIKTIVTTELGRAIASSYGIEIINTLTGFKYIGEKINQFDATGETFVFGYEESYGYLISSFARDKDAVQATVMATEMAYYWKQKGMTLLDALEQLYKKHGYYKEGLDSLTLEGKAGQEEIANVMKDMRNQMPSTFGRLRTLYIEDYLQGTRTNINNLNKVETIDLPTENVLKYVLEDDCWVCLRPSGTEPKIKWYYGAYGKTEDEVALKLTSLQGALSKILNGPK